ncbi:Heat induced stress protein YflT [uncultured archaeon]|nr:Heat induced stress protein YflT [uncultured archaeon]
MATNKAVFGIYKTRVGVESAVDALKAAGFRSSDISVLMPEKTSTKEFAHEKHTKAPEGAATGAGSGLVIGGALGWLAGIGALAIPGVGPFIAAGPLMAALAGAGVGGAVGGIVGALVGMGVPEYEAKRYEGLINKGGILLSVHTDSSEWAKRAEEILKSTGAEDISTTGEAKAEETVPPRTTVVTPHTVESETVVTEKETVVQPHAAEKTPSTEY